jgi:hypothetical protein
MTTPLPAQSACSAPATSKGRRLVVEGRFEWAEAAPGELSLDEAVMETAAKYVRSGYDFSHRMGNLSRRDAVDP